MKKFFVALVITIFLGVVPSYSAVRTQNNTYYIDDATGSAQIRNGNTSTAREEARRNAYRDAIDKAIGSIVSGISERNSYGTMRDRVYSQASGLIKNFKITSENINDGIITITGSCTVSEKSFDGVLGPEVISMLGNPRVMIVVDQPQNDKDNKKASGLSPLELELHSMFEKAGYLIVDMDQAQTLLKLDSKNSYNDTERLIAAAKTLRADIIVVAKAESSSRKQSALGQTWYIVSGTVHIKAVQTQTAYQIGTATASGGNGKGSRSASAGGILSSSIRKAAEDIIYKIAYRMASAGSSLGGITVNVKISNADYKDVVRIKENFAAWLGSTGELFQRSFENRNVEFDIVSQKKAEDIAAFLSDYAEIEGLTTQTITARSGRQTAPPVTASAPRGDGMKISITISNVKRLSVAQEFAQGLQGFVGSGAKVENSYSNPVANITITYDGNAQDVKSLQDISGYLSKQDITIDGTDEAKKTITGYSRRWF